MSYKLRSLSVILGVFALSNKSLSSAHAQVKSALIKSLMINITNHREQQFTWIYKILYVDLLSRKVILGLLEFNNKNLSGARSQMKS